MAVPGDPGNLCTLRTAAQGVFEQAQRSIVNEHADDAAGSQCGRDRGTGRKVSQVVAVRQLISGEYLIQVSETELALIKTALERTERVSRVAAGNYGRG